MENNTLKKRVYWFYEKNKEKGKKFTVNHFISEGYSRSLIYQYIKDSDNGLSSDRKIGSGLKPKIMNKTNLSRLVSILDHSDRISQRQLARKFKCSQSYISKTIKKKTNIKCRKKKNS